MTTNKDNRRRLSVNPHELRITIAMLEFGMMARLAHQERIPNLPTDSDDDIISLIDKYRSYLPTESDTLRRLRQAALVAPPQATTQAPAIPRPRFTEPVLDYDPTDKSHPKYDAEADPTSDRYIDISKM